jgi:hypothetical protein
VSDDSFTACLLGKQAVKTKTKIKDKYFIA